MNLKYLVITGALAASIMPTFPASQAGGEMVSTEQFAMDAPQSLQTEIVANAAGLDQP